MTKQSITFLKKVYTIDYILKNPSSSSKGLKQVWQAAVLEYMSKQGVDLSDKKNYHRPIEGIEFPKIVKIFNGLIGKNKKTSKVVKSKRVS